MINLLPEKEKDALFLGRIKNLVITLSVIILVSFICLILILLSIKYYILSEVDYQKFLFEGAQKQYQTPDVANLKDNVQKYNAILPTVLSFYQSEIYFSDILGTISEIPRPQGLYLTNISIDKDRKVSISGFSNTRENLIAFQKSLTEQSAIKNVLFSPQSWINPVKINFNLTLEYGN